MTMFRYLSFLMVMFLSLPSIVLADQKDPRLNELFFNLKIVSTQSEAEYLSGNIWNIWSSHLDEKINRALSNGKIAASNQENKLALQYFNQVIELDPDFAEGWNKRATLYYMTGDYQASLDDIEETLKLEPRHFGALSGRGMCYIKLDNWLLAISAFEKALDVNPWLVEAQHNIDLLKRLLKQVAFNGISTKVINN